MLTSSIPPSKQAGLTEICAGTQQLQFQDWKKAHTPSTLHWKASNHATSTPRNLMISVQNPWHQQLQEETMMTNKFWQHWHGGYWKRLPVWPGEWWFWPEEIGSTFRAHWKGELNWLSSPTSPCWSPTSNPCCYTCKPQDDRDKPWDQCQQLPAEEHECFPSETSTKLHFSTFKHDHQLHPEMNIYWSKTVIEKWTDRGLSIKKLDNFFKQNCHFSVTKMDLFLLPDWIYFKSKSVMNFICDHFTGQNTFVTVQNGILFLPVIFVQHWQWKVL